MLECVECVTRVSENNCDRGAEKSAREGVSLCPTSMGLDPAGILIQMFLQPTLAMPSIAT